MKEKEIGTNFKDRRILDREFAKGNVSDADMQAHLKALKDETENAQWVQMDLHDAEISEGSGDGSGDSAEGGA